MLVRVDVRFTREGILRTVYRLQSQRSPVTVQSIVDEVECCENTVRAHVKALAVCGYIEQVPGTGRGKSRARYRIAPLGREVLSVA